ncbi:MAG TPA: hypothetical protein VF591_00195 [Pyrinomonadaceae bacterium]|jgi:DNA-directed RNA polymerase specialized sigma24 family protein
MADQDPPPDAVTGPWSAFGDDPEGAGEQFKHLHRKLTYYFESRRCDDPSELAHKTLERLMQKYGEHVEIKDLTRFSYGIAKKVRYEYLREKEAEKRYITEQEYRSRADAPEEDAEARKERKRKCMEECSARLSESDRTMLTDYFNGRGRSRQQRRERMAEQLKISLQALRLRVFYLRRGLKKCLEKCLEEE